MGKVIYINWGIIISYQNWNPMHISMEHHINITFECPIRKYRDWIFNLNEGYDGIGCGISLIKFIWEYHLQISRYPQNTIVVVWWAILILRDWWNNDVYAERVHCKDGWSNCKIHVLRLESMRFYLSQNLLSLQCLQNYAKTSRNGIFSVVHHF